MSPESAKREMRRRFGGPVALGVSVVILDQLTKRLIRTRVGVHESIPILDGFVSIVHARNPGAAFSLFADMPGWFRGPFFIGITVTAIVVLFYVISRLPAEDRLMRVALGGVLGGAVGNLIDRLIYGEVTDFIDVHWRSYHWPAFNVADSSITIAVSAVILQSLFGRSEARRTRGSGRRAHRRLDSGAGSRH
jgi:signal peptidase II